MLPSRRVYRLRLTAYEEEACLCKRPWPMALVVCGVLDSTSSLTKMTNLYRWMARRYQDMEIRISNVEITVSICIKPGRSRGNRKNDNLPRCHSGRAARLELTRLASIDQEQTATPDKDKTKAGLRTDNKSTHRSACF